MKKTTTPILDADGQPVVENTQPKAKRITILTGSRAFFEGLDGFAPHDTDKIIVTPRPHGFKYLRQTRLRDKCIFEVADLPKQQLIDLALNGKTAMTLGRFLTPDYAQHLGLTTDDLRQLQPLVEKLDDRHQYAAIIFDAYLHNGTFTLTDEQRQAAFAAYKAARPASSVPDGSAIGNN